MPEIEFLSSGTVCRGYHFPPSAPFGPSSASAPCVLMGHGFAGTWRSGLEPFARRFAENGFHAVVFDYRFLGGSDGHPRQLITIRRQLADWHAAIDFARSLEGVDPARIIVWGTSLGGGHVIRIASEDRRITAVIALAPLLDGFQMLTRMARSAGIGHVMRLMGHGGVDLIASLLGAGPRRLPVVGAPGTLAALTSPDSEPGYRAVAGPDWENRFCSRTALTVGAYRPGRGIGRLACPILVQIPDRDDILPLRDTERHLRRLGPKGRIARYPGGHFDVYTGDLFAKIVEDQVTFLTDLFPEIGEGEDRSGVPEASRNHQGTLKRGSQ